LSKTQSLWAASILLSPPGESYPGMDNLKLRFSPVSLFLLISSLLFAGCNGISLLTTAPKPSPSPVPVSSPTPSPTPVLSPSPTPSPTATPTPSPVPTPQPALPNHVLVKVGSSGELYQEYAITSSGLERID